MCVCVYIQVYARTCIHKQVLHMHTCTCMVITESVFVLFSTVHITVYTLIHCRCLVSYKDDNFKKPYIIALGSGTGTVEEINEIGLLKDNMVAYGLYRVVRIEHLQTVQYDHFPLRGYHGFGLAPNAIMSLLCTPSSV